MSRELFARALKAHYDELKASQNALYSGRDPEYDLLANKRTRTTRVVCETLWWSTERALEVLQRKYTQDQTKVLECCIGFFVSETWLGETVVGDTFLICDSWDIYDSCLKRVEEVFPYASSRWEKLASQIVRTHQACLHYFKDNAPETIDAQLIRDVHKMLASPDLESPSVFRKSPSSNESALPYLNHKDIDDYLDELLKFVNEQRTTSFKERMLLAVLFFERFLWIHPFQEGNGRTAPLLFSLLLKPFCPHLPLSMLWRTCENPRDFYIHSIRANPSRGPMCLAFYTLKCLNENFLRILDCMSPGAFLEDDVSETQLTDTQKRVWLAVSDAYPSLRPGDIVWLEKSATGFLVIIGEESFDESSATVHKADDIAAVRALTVNRTWRMTKIFRRSELFDAEILIAEPVAPPVAPYPAKAAFENAPNGTPRMVCDVVVSLSTKISQSWEASKRE